MSIVSNTFGKRFTVGFITHQMEFGYAEDLWKGLEEKAVESDVNVIYFPGRIIDDYYEYSRHHNVIYHFINHYNLDAVIMNTGVIASIIDWPEFRKFYKRFSHLPMVSLTRKIEGIPSILIDNKKGMSDAVEHLITRHHYKKIAFVQGPENSIDARERFEAYQEVLKKRGIPVKQEYILPGNFRWDSGIHAMEIMLNERKIKPEAIVFANDQMAFHAIQYLRRHGYRIPQDFAIIGFDDTEEARFEIPPLTSVHQPVQDLGKKALEVLTDMVQGKKVPETIYLPTYLVIRSSCGCTRHNKIYEEITDIEPRQRTIFQSLDIVISSISLEVAEKYYKSYNILYRDQEFEKEVHGIVKHYVHSLKNREPNKQDLFDSFQNLAVSYISNNKKITRLQEILFLTSSEIALHLKTPKELEINNDLYQTLSIKIGEWCYIDEGQLRLRTTYDFFTVRHATQRLSPITKVKDLIATLFDILKDTWKMGGFFITLYQNPWFYDNSFVWNISGKSTILMGYTDKKMFDYKKNEEFDSHYLLPEKCWPKERRFSWAIYPLFYREIHFGTIVYEIMNISSVAYETLTTQIGSCYQNIRMFEEMEHAGKVPMSAMDTFKLQNERINASAQKDDLTGVYNQQGFTALAERNFGFAAEFHKNCHLVIFELDNYQEISATFGQREGELSLIRLVDILQSSFRSVDIIGRIGERKFVVMTIDTNPALLEITRARINDKINAFNETSGLEYKIKTSFTGIPVLPNIDSDLLSIIRGIESQNQSPEEHPVA